MFLFAHTFPSLVTRASQIFECIQELSRQGLSSEEIDLHKAKEPPPNHVKGHHEKTAPLCTLLNLLLNLSPTLFHIP